jgi:hypothetical protein
MRIGLAHEITSEESIGWTMTRRIVFSSAVAFRRLA